MWHMTCDTWHVTRDIWHMTCDTWHVTFDMLWGVNILSKFQLPSSYRLWFMILWRFGGKVPLMSNLMSNRGVCRTAPATPGLLKILIKYEEWSSNSIQLKAPAQAQVLRELLGKLFSMTAAGQIQILSFSPSTDFTDEGDPRVCHPKWLIGIAFALDP